MQKSSAALAQVFYEAAQEPPSASSNGHITSVARDPERISRPAPPHRHYVSSLVSCRPVADLALYSMIMALLGICCAAVCLDLPRRNLVQCWSLLLMW